MASPPVAGGRRVRGPGAELAELVREGAPSSHCPVWFIWRAITEIYRAVRENGFNVHV